MCVQWNENLQVSVKKAEIDVIYNKECKAH